MYYDCESVEEITEWFYERAELLGLVPGFIAYNPEYDEVRAKATHALLASDRELTREEVRETLDWKGWCHSGRFYPTTSLMYKRFGLQMSDGTVWIDDSTRYLVIND